MDTTTTVTLQTKQLSQAVFTQLMDSSLDSLKAYRTTSGDLMVASLLTRLDDNLPQLRASLKQKRGSDITKDLNQTIKARKTDFSALSHGLKLYKPTRSAEKAKAYQTLSDLFKSYQSLTRSSIEESSALLTSFLNKLEGQPYAEAVSILNLNEAVDNLRDSHNSACNYYLQRLQENKTIDGEAIRRVMDKDYQLLYNNLVNKVEYDHNAPEKIMLQLLNKVRAEYAEKQKRHKNKQASKNSKDTQTNDE